MIPSKRSLTPWTIATVLQVGLLCLCLQPLTVQAQQLEIVAAENFYGDIAAQIGGEYVHVTSILTNPEQDPHLFEASAATARALHAARLVIYNGVQYDPWMTGLLGASKSDTRKELVVGALTGHKSGDNPHIWYDPRTMPLVAKAVADALSEMDPAHTGAYAASLGRFMQSLTPLEEKIESIRQSHPRIAATATEPVFGYMAEALGFSMRDLPFQLAVMNDTEPAASDIVRMERNLRTHQVSVLFYNSQASSRAALRMKKAAFDAHVPVVGVTETLPPGKNYQAWMLDQLVALGAQLPGSGK